MTYKKSPGFSLIEIIMVLAIVGFMMLLVFYAIDQAQRQRHDQEREAAAGRYLQAFEQWITDNSGVIPTLAGPHKGCIGTSLTNCVTDPANGVEAKYITAGGASFNAPDGQPWKQEWWDSANNIQPMGDMMEVRSNAGCQNGVMNSFINSHAQRELAVAVALQNGGVYCISQQ